jgi:hypothetical protein
MDEMSQFALEVARRILKVDAESPDSASNSRLVTDLAELVRQSMCGEKLLAESSYWLRTHGAVGMPVHY